MGEKMSAMTLIGGVGMIPFSKPGKSGSYDEMGAEAARLALRDAGIPYDVVETAFVGYVYGDSTSGQTALYQLGQTGIPIINVNNNCATGSSALFLARSAVESGDLDVALALGFEQMKPGALGLMFEDRKPSTYRFAETTSEIQGWQMDVPSAAQLFGGAGLDHQNRYGTKPETFAKVSVKARKHASVNPNAVFRDAVTVEEVLNSKSMFGPLTRLQCCPPTCGAAAAIVVSRRFAEKNGLRDAVPILAQAMTTDTPSTFESRSMMRVVGYDMTKAAASQVYEAAAIGPDQIDVVELHDCFTANELISYEALGLCPEGGAEQFIQDDLNTYGGQVVVNPSGGLLSKGHPLGATGLAQCAELVWQLRGSADARQVDGARFALQHNLGLGGACVVTLYSAPA